MKTSIGYFIWLLSLKLDNLKFKYSLNKPENSQWKILKKYLKNNKNTLYGKKYNFKYIRSIEEFQRNVPIVKYSDIKNYVDNLKEGKKNILSYDKTLFFEETTGTENISKLIPYNNSLKQEFIAAIGPWITSLNKNFKGIFAGKSYWSISAPLKKKSKTKSVIKIGLDSDSGYLNKTGVLLSKYLILNISSNNSSEKFYINSLKKMFKEKKLGFISVYSPSFLIQLDNILRLNWDSIIPKSLNIEKNSKWSEIFKNVKLISCWLDSSSSQFESEIKSFLGDIPIQKKGLLSTEGIVSFPYIKNKDPLLAITSHFFEFLSIADNKIYLAHNLNINEKYEVIMSTGNGIMRYKTNDIIKVTNYVKNTPTIRFIGRRNKISDIVGEKISEIFCLKTLESMNKSFRLLNHGGFFYIKKESNTFSYNFAIYSSNKDLETKEVNEFLEIEFNKNQYYSQAIKLNQLKKLKTIIISKNKYKNLMNVYFDYKKVKDGDRKPPILFNLEDSSKIFL